jgi:DNA-binding NarL/FixJ family response regulator
LSDQRFHIRVLLACSHSLFREAVKAVLESGDDFVVVSEARDGLHAVIEARNATPDVVILEANLPNCDGLRAAALIHDHDPSCRCILLVPEEDQESLLEAVEAGVAAYLTKECPLPTLLEAVARVHRGETLIPSRMLGPLLTTLTNRRAGQDEAIRCVATLTRREKEVLALLVEGANNDSIAQALVISPQTARTHVQSILGKLKVHSRLEAAAFVLNHRVADQLVGVLS